MARRILVAVLVAFGSWAGLGSFAGLAADELDLVVVRPGGPNPSEEAQAQVARLIEEIGARAGRAPGSVTAFYFNDTEEALAHISRDRPSFVLTTPGFFLSHRKDLGLAPVNQVLMGDRDTHQYFVVVRKDTFGSLEDLKGGSLVGAPMAEPDFIERIVFERRLDFDTAIDARYARALSSLRRLAKGEISAVILDATEHRSLESLPFADSLETIFSSEQVPNTGIFALEGTARAVDIEALAAACRDFCTDGEGAAICETYQISGFQPLAPGVFDEMVREYDE